MQFLAKYAEVSRVLRFLDGSTAQSAQRVFDLYKRHAGEVTRSARVCHSPLRVSGADQGGTGSLAAGRRACVVAGAFASGASGTNQQHGQRRVTNQSEEAAGKPLPATREALCAGNPCFADRRFASAELRRAGQGAEFQAVRRGVDNTMLIDCPMTEAELLQILARGEDSRHQFKRDVTRGDSVKLSRKSPRKLSACYGC